MGTPVPIVWPDIDDGKWYKTTIDKFFDLTPKTGCAQLYTGREHCCTRGDILNDWISTGQECRIAHGLCGVVDACRLICVIGEWDSQAECIAAL